MDKVNSAAITAFLSKVNIAKKTNQRLINISAEEASEIALQLGILMSLALENAQKDAGELSGNISVQADGGTF